MTSIETPFFFGTGDRRLFGVFHAPGAELRSALVFCHPFAEEKLWSHRVLVSLARDLADSGYAVLRFDMSGTGDSDGEFASADVGMWLSDVGRALDELNERVPAGTRFGLLGLRLGATVAALFADHEPRVSDLILWEPIIDGAKYGQEVLLTNLAMQMAAHGKVVIERAELVKKMEAGETVNIDGYDVSHPLYRQIAAIELLRSPRPYDRRCLIVQIDRAERPVRKEIQALAERYRQAQIVRAVEQPFWKEIKEFYARTEKLSALTRDWLAHAADNTVATGKIEQSK